MSPLPWYYRRLLRFYRGHIADAAVYYNFSTVEKCKNLKSWGDRPSSTASLSYAYSYY